MPVLRTNYRLTGNELGPDVLGRGIMNWMEGSNVIKGWHGGFIMGSWARANPPTTAGIIPISARGAMSDYFGETFAAAVGNGFRVMPVHCVVLNDGIFPTASTVMMARPCFSYSGSIAFVTALHGSITDVILEAIAQTDSIAFYWVGFIVSTPWSKYTTS